jgi:uncharacterized protein
MKTLMSLFVGIGMICGAAFADTVHLKNGSTVEGQIIAQTADAVKVDVGGTTVTYYADEIASVDKADASVAAVIPAAEVPAPVVDVVAAPPAQDGLAVMSKEDLINRFVEIYGVKQNMQANFDQMTSTLKPEDAAAFRNSVKVDDIIRELLPVYDKHFTADDLRAYIRFYGSNEGKKLVQTLPLLMKDSVEVSVKYLDMHLPESLKQSQPVE